MLHGKLFVALLKSFEHLFERVGRLAHGRNDDEEILLVVDNLAQVAHSVGIPHRRTAKFVNLHVISLFNLTYLLYRPKATGRRTPAAERRVERPHPNASRRRRLPRRDRASARIISVFSPLCKAPRYSGTGTNRCPPPRRYVFEVGLPAPWPAFDSMRISAGRVAPPVQRCIWAANLNECAGTTRSSWSAVVIERRGVLHVPSRMLCSGE